MTYKELLEQLSKLTEEQLGRDITIYDPYEDEVYAANAFYEVNNDDIVDDGQYVIRF